MTWFLFVFGLAIFLFAMKNLEQGIREASGDSLEKWVIGKTNTALGSAGSGVVVTAILQSSSMVSLIVLAFVSAGVMPLYNGIGVVLGANLGTTFTGWVATVVGFKMNLQALIVPLLGIGAICQFGYFNGSKVGGIGRTLFAFGLLIYGLDIMKDSVTGVAQIIDISALKGMHAVVYFLAGILLAAIMQSSSAVMIITLSMLNSNLLELSNAAAIVVGADLGTTSTTILGSIGQSVVKKQLAFAQVFFNFSTNALAFTIMLPILPNALAFFAIDDVMFGLVTFHSAFNLMGLLIFLPLLKFYTRWVERVLPIPDDRRTHFFEVPIEVSDIALDSLCASVDCLASDAVGLSADEFSLSTIKLTSNDGQPVPVQGSFEHRYEALKTLEARIVSYANRLQATALDQRQGARLASLVAATRDFVYASKTLKDVRNDYQKLADLEGGAASLFQTHRAFLQTVFDEAFPLCKGQHETSFVKEKIDEIAEKNGRHYEQANALVSDIIHNDSHAITNMSTWFNLNHELHHCVRYLLSAIVERCDIES